MEAFEKDGEAERMTPDEARAVVRLWSRREWEREHWPTVADVAEGLGIPPDEAARLLGEVRASPHRRPRPQERERGAGSEAGGAFRLAVGTAGLTGFFCLALERLLA